TLSEVPAVASDNGTIYSCVDICQHGKCENAVVLTCLDMSDMNRWPFLVKAYGPDGIQGRIQRLLTRGGIIYDSSKDEETTEAYLGKTVYKCYCHSISLLMTATIRFPKMKYQRAIGCCYGLNKILVSKHKKDIHENKIYDCSLLLLVNMHNVIKQNEVKIDIDSLQERVELHTLIICANTSARLLQGKTIDRYINPGAIVHDTSAQAVILSRDKSEDVQGLLLLDITTFSINIETPGGIIITMINTISACPQSTHRLSQLTQPAQCTYSSILPFSVVYLRSQYADNNTGKKNRLPPQMTSRDKVSSNYSLKSYIFNVKAIVECKKNIKGNCNEIIDWFNKNNIVEKETLASQQEDLENVCNPIINKH
ncbi:hypothetical protein E2I00_018904, partial [Balaenoptera physalus]